MLAIAICPPAGPVAPVENVDAPQADALIACIGPAPITGELFSHWLAIARKGSGDDAPARDLREQVMDFLVTGKWIEGEAAERGIKVSDRAVRHRLAKQRRESFPDKRDFRRFLEQSGMTRSDIKYRVRLDMLSERVRVQVNVFRFRKKWKARTSCLAAYSGDNCGQTL
jgi:hypothetical protein